MTIRNAGNGRVLARLACLVAWVLAAGGAAAQSGRGTAETTFAREQVACRIFALGEVRLRHEKWVWQSFGTTAGEWARMNAAALAARNLICSDGGLTLEKVDMLSTDATIRLGNVAARAALFRYANGNRIRIDTALDLLETMRDERQKQHLAGCGAPDLLAMLNMEPGAFATQLQQEQTPDCGNPPAARGAPGEVGAGAGAAMSPYAAQAEIAACMHPFLTERPEPAACSSVADGDRKKTPKELEEEARKKAEEAKRKQEALKKAEEERKKAEEDFKAAKEAHEKDKDNFQKLIQLARARIALNEAQAAFDAAQAAYDAARLDALDAFDIAISAANDLVRSAEDAIEMDNLIIKIGAALALPTGGGSLGPIIESVIDRDIMQDQRDAYIHLREHLERQQRRVELDPECLVATLADGGLIAGSLPQRQGRFTAAPLRDPVAALRGGYNDVAGAFRYCQCQTGVGIGVLPNLACPTETEAAALDCIATPLGPDDAPRPECIALWQTQAAVAVPDARRACSLMQCGPGDVAINNPDGSCGCMPIGALAERLRPDFGMCQSIDCGPEAFCSCGDAGCRCLPVGYESGAPMRFRAIP